MDASEICRLADEIKANATILSEYYSQNKLPQPSFDVDGVSAPVSATDDRVKDALGALLGATHELHHLALGPAGIVSSIRPDDILCLQVIHRYKIALKLGIHEQVSFEALSERCGINPRDLQRILRYAMTNYIFQEPRPGIVAHSAASRVLVENANIRDYVGAVSDVRFSASARVSDAIAKYGLAKKSSESGFSLSRNTSRGLYDELAQNPEEERQWNGAMSALAQKTDFKFILDSFAWDDYPNATIVDVGGGRGDLSIGLAKHLPTCKFIVQDLSHSAVGQKTIDGESDPRIEFQLYDFRDLQPVEGAEIYYFRNIFHNWPDALCVDILRNHIPALKKGAKLLIDDFALHEPGTLPTWEERKRRSMDMAMLTYFGSRERTIDDWKALLMTAYPKFKLVKATFSKRQPNTILEVTWG